MTARAPAPPPLRTRQPTRLRPQDEKEGRHGADLAGGGQVNDDDDGGDERPAAFFLTGVDGFEAVGTRADPDDYGPGAGYEYVVRAASGGKSSSSSSSSKSSKSSKSSSSSSSSSCCCGGCGGRGGTAALDLPDDLPPWRKPPARGQRWRRRNTIQ